MSKTENQDFFTSETKAQINIGKRLASQLKQSTGNTFQAVVDLAVQCLDRDEDWQKYHRAEVQRAAPTATPESAITLAVAELNAWKLALAHQYGDAAREVAGLVDGAPELSNVDKGWYLQLEAQYLYHVDRPTALEIQKKAHELNSQVLKPPEGVAYRKVQKAHGSQAAAILAWVHKFNESNALIADANEILDRLNFGEPSDLFESAFCDLASIVGLRGQRPEKEYGRGPDVLWDMTDSHFLVVEAKNQEKLDRPTIFKRDAEQLAVSSLWFEKEYSTEGTHLPVLIHPAADLAHDAYVPENSRVLLPELLQNLVTTIREFVTALAQKPPNQWDIAGIAELITAHSISPGPIREKFFGVPIQKKSS